MGSTSSHGGFSILTLVLGVYTPVMPGNNPPYFGELLQWMLNNPLIRPYLFWGDGIGGVPLGSHDYSICPKMNMSPEK